MTGLEAIKQAVTNWWVNKYNNIDLRDGNRSIEAPPYINKLCHVVYRLKREVFDLKKGIWEYEGF